MKFIENNTYTLQTDYYNSVKVVCTYVEDGVAYFHSKTTQDVWNVPTELSYKLILKTQKLYQWNCAYISWDSVENTLSEDPLGNTVDDVWSKRVGNGSDYYSGIGQD